MLDLARSPGLRNLLLGSLFRPSAGRCLWVLKLEDCGWAGDLGVLSYVSYVGNVLCAMEVNNLATKSAKPMTALKT